MHAMDMGIGFLWVFLPFLALALGGRVLERMEQRAVEHRRQGMLRSNHEAAVYRIAKELGGYVTVSDVVVRLGISPADAEQLLQSMTDGLRVQMEVSDSGLVTYEFPELKPHQPPGGEA